MADPSAGRRPPAGSRAERQAQRRGAGGAAAASRPRGDGGSRRSPSDKRKKPIVPIAIGVGVVLIVAVAAFVVLSGGGGDDKKAGPSFKESTVVDLTAGKTALEYAANGTNIEFPPDAQQAVLSDIGTYVDDGIVASLRTGKANDKAMDAVFEPAAAEQAKGTDRAGLYDEGLPPAVGKVEVKATPVGMTGLVTADSKVNFIAARILFHISSETEQGVITITRFGEIVFSRDLGDAWKITSFAIRADRDGPGVEPAPTTAPPVPAAGDQTSPTVAP